ncbi:MAG: protein kinase [Anaerolineae bacterium]|nr:protein kinase [Anaerolineae bacterium]
MSDLSGQSIKGYDLHELIGAGGFGAVYRAHQPLIKRDVAIKIILPEYANQPDFIRSFEYEAQLVARLEHIHIVTLYDYWRDPHGAYLVMRWLRGGSLRQRLKRGAIDNTIAVKIVEQIGSALSAAHRRGVVHRDIKPDNILFDDDGNAFLADFGIAKDVRETIPDTTTADLHDEPGDKEQEESTLTGSPFYLAPEQAQSHPVSAQSDLYSLGIVMYEILTGQPPFTGDKGLMAILLKHINEPIPSVRDLRPDLTADVDLVLQRATAKDPADRYQDANNLANEFRRAMLRMDAPVVQPRASGPEVTIDIVPETLRMGGVKTIDIDAPITIDIDAAVQDKAGEATDDDMLVITKPISGATVIVVPPAEVVNPYKGLQPFEEADATDFHGREDLIERLLDRLREPVELSRFLAVIGPSGSGKSSVVKAGLIPRLRQGALRNSERWYMIEMKPGADPFRELDAALLSIAVNPPADLQDQLRTDERALVGAVEAILAQSGGSGLVLTIDQFEEVFTQMQHEDERAHFLNLLQTTVTDLDCPFRLLITLRADFYDRPLLYPEFGELVRVRNEVVLPMSNDELREAIVAPAEHAGVSVESGLVAEIVSELGEQQGALPLLQYALTELFERRTDNVMTLAAYRETGGVLGALARRADELYEATDAAGQEVLRQIFLRLVTISDSGDDTRRRVQQIELMSLIEDSDFVVDLLDQWSKARLLTSDRDPDTRMPVVTVAHESLIRQWERLRHWLDDNREDLLLQRRLQQAFEEWIEHQRADDLLAHGILLQRFEGLVESASIALTPEENNYVAASVAKRERLAAAERARQEHEARLEKQAKDRLRLLAIVMAAAAVIALVLAGLALLSYQEAEDQREVANEQKVIAEREADIAGSLNLSTTSLLAYQNDNNEKALVCALEANELTDPPLASQDILFDVALAPGTVRVFEGHDAAVRSGVFSTDGALILSGSRDNTLKLWDAATGEELHTFTGHEDWVNRVDLSPDGTLAISGSADATVRLWDVATGDELDVFNDHGDQVRVVAFSPDGALALSVSWDDTVMLWDVEKRELLHVFADTEVQIETVTETDPETGQEVEKDIEVQVDIGADEDWSVFGLETAAFSPDGSAIVMGAYDGSLELWDVTTYELIRSFEADGKVIGAVAFNPSGTQLLAASEDRFFLFDVATGEVLASFNPGQEYYGSLSFTRNGQQFFAAGSDNNITLWQWDVAGDLVNKLDVFVGHSSYIAQITLSPDGKQLLSSSNDGTMRLWDLINGSEIQRYEGHTGVVDWVHVSADGALLMASTNSDNMIRVWDITTGEEKAALQVPYGIMATAFSPDGKRVVSTDNGDTGMILWDWQTGEQLLTWTGVAEFENDAASVKFTPDSQYIVTGMGVGDGTIRVWDVVTGELVHTWPILDDAGEAQDSELNRIAISPDGSQVLTRSTQNETLVLLNLTDGAELWRKNGQFGGINFSPDGSQVLATADNTIQILDAGSGELLHELTGHNDSIFQAMYSPDGSQIVSGSYDGTLRVWDIASETVIRQLAHGGEINTVAFGMDGATIFSGASDGTVQRWDATPMTLDRIYAWIDAHRYEPSDATCLD